MRAPYNGLKVGDRVESLAPTLYSKLNRGRVLYLIPGFAENYIAVVWDSSEYITDEMAINVQRISDPEA